MYEYIPINSWTGKGPNKYLGHEQDTLLLTSFHSDESFLVGQDTGFLTQHWNKCIQTYLFIHTDVHNLNVYTTGQRTRMTMSKSIYKTCRNCTNI